MKKLILIFLLSFIWYFTYSQTQVYHPFPESEAFWSETSDGYQCNCCAQYQYLISGDTVISGTLYHKITHSGKSYSSGITGNCLFSGWSTPFVDYKGAFRNDSAARKVWFVPAGESTEQVLYDFDLELNDTLTATYINNPGLLSDDYGNIVQSVDSVLVGDEYHKRFGIATTQQPGFIYAYIIEGVGSTFGLFGSLGVLWPPFEFASMLGCLSVNGESVFPESNMDCLLITDMHKPILVKVFNIYPNPLNEYSRVIIPEGIPACELTIKDMNGREVQSYAGVSSNTIIYRNNLERGIYLYFFSQKGIQLYSGKLIVN